MIEYQFLNHISGKQSDQLEQWLIEENNTSSSGFYCNWNIIANRIKEDKVCCLSIDGEIAAFLIWQDYDLNIRIDIAEVKPNMRRKGLGNHLINESLKQFRAMDFMVVDLECNPPSSELFWRQCGFQDFPKSKDVDLFTYDNHRLYKSLYQTLEFTMANGLDEVIEIWKNEPYEIKDEVPDWTWVIENKDLKGNLMKPIIHPCKRDWKIRWRKGNNIFKESKVKRFQKDDICHGDFIIIKNLS